MTRNLKVLGIALAAVFALSAMVASAASAAQAYITSDGPFKLTASETGTETNRWKMFGTFTECPGTTYTGGKLNTTPEEVLSHELAETTVTIVPKYVNCVATALKLKAEIDMEGCDYVFHLGETTGVADTYGVRFTIKCPAGKHIKKTIPAIGCTITITERTGAFPEDSYTGLTAKDTTAPANDLDITGIVTGIEAHAGPGCPGAGTTTKTGELGLDLTVNGENKNNESTGIGISEFGESTTIL
ncbi:MAG TPA: hypothetical protein VIP57_12360 [Candidatus Dormibacteraeota bacterium]